MPTNARKKHWIGTGGPWGTGLLVLGIMSIALGGGYLVSDPADLPDALQHLTPPIWFWAPLWVAAGISAVVNALTPPQTHWDVWPVVGMSSFWSATYAYAWLVNGIVHGVWDRTWSGAVVFAAFAALIISWGRCVNPPQRDQ